jgi:hypothetical protein
MHFYFHLFSQFGLPYPSYYYFKSFSFGATSFGSFTTCFKVHTAAFIKLFNGLAFCYGYLSQAIQDASGI